MPYCGARGLHRLLADQLARETKLVKRRTYTQHSNRQNALSAGSGDAF